MYEANESLAKQALADATEQHCDEHSENMELWHRDDFFVSSNKKQQKPARGEIQHDIAWVNSDNDLCTMVNGVSEKLNHKLLHNFSSKEENKGTTETGLSMGLEHVNANIFTATSPYDIIPERKDPSLSCDSLLEEQKNSSLLYSLNVKKPIDHSQISNNLEYMKDVYHYSPAEYSQISKNIETKENAYHHPPPEDQPLDCISCLKEREMSVDLLKHFHVGSEAEFSEVHTFNLQLEVYAQVLQETLREVFPEIGHLNGEVFNLQKKMRHCTDNKDFLVLKLNTVLDQFRTLREAKEKDMTRYNDLVSRSRVMEGKLNEILDEKNLLVQKVEDHHGLIANSRVYESKYKMCFEEKNKLEDMLKEEKSQRAYFLSEINSLIEELKPLKEQYEKKCSLNSDLQESVTDLQGKLRDLCNWIILHNQYIDSIFGNITVTEELDSENYDVIISHLEQFQQKVSRLLRFQQEKKVLKEQLDVAQCKLNERESHILYMKQKFESELGELSTKLELSSTEIQYLQIEFQDTVEKLKLSKETEEWHRLENANLLSSISILEVKLQQATHECQNLCQKLLEEDSAEKEVLVLEKKDSFFSAQSGNEASIKMEYELSSLKDGLHYAHDRLLRLQQGKKITEEQRKVTQCTLNERELHILHMKEKFESELEEVRTNLDHSRIKVQHLHIELQDALEKLKLSKKAEEWQRLENKKLLSNMSVLEVELQQSTDKCREFCQKLLDVESVEEEFAKTKSRLADLIQENKELLSFIQSGNEASDKLEHELSSLKDSLHYTKNKLLSERKCREELEISFSDLKLQALEMSQKLLAVTEQNAELCYLKMRALDLEKDVQQCMACCKERDRKIDSETSSLYLEVSSMEDEVVATFERLISADVELTFMKDQFCSKMEKIIVYQKKSENILEELHLKQLDGVASQEKYIISEAVLVAERERLSTELLSSKSMIEVLFGEKETLLDANIVIQAEFEDLKSKGTISEASFAKKEQHHEDEVFVLRSMLLRFRRTG
ncbi:hypothetical protein KSP39_PZI020710 [Platanthera zijinensis]|uniref:Uncharacterized protein n=1 Tax=Platanthera zijinensis TaxID=2320716 RepID=A0AAP0FXG5_9ASPA